MDLKRLAVSVILAAGNLQIDAGQAAAFAAATVRAYRERMAELAVMGPLDAWYDRIDVDAVLTIARQRRAKDLQRQLSTAKLRHRTSLHVLPKLTSVLNGTRKIIDDPPLIGHFDPEAFDGQKMIAAYAESLPPDRRPLLERYQVLDTARKVAGVGSVGTRCYLSLLTDADARSPIFLQLKEAMEAVFAPYAGKSEFAHAGQRVVVGQRLMQAASDMFLGWNQLSRPRLLRAAVPRHERLGQPRCHDAERRCQLRRGVRQDAGPCARAVRRRRHDSGIHGHRDAVRRVDHGIRSGLRQASPARLRRSGRRGRVRPDHCGQGLVAAPPRGRGLLRASRIACC